jgi:hypothetical protein
MRRSSLLVLVLLLAACNARGSQTPWAYDDHVGVVVASAERACLMIKVPAIAVKSPLQVVVPGSADVHQAFVIASVEECVGSADQDGGLHGYTIQFEGSPPKPPPFDGIALLGAPASLRARAASGSTIADLDGDGREEFIRLCLSSEGVHYTIWSDAPITGRRRWHQYHYLGYDVEPSCTQAETTIPLTQ